MLSKPDTPQDANQGTMELFLVLLVTIVFPPILLFGFFVVNPREEIVVLRFGKYVTTLKTQGIRWIHPVGRKLCRISTRDTTLDIATTTVVEVNGNPEMKGRPMPRLSRSSANMRPGGKRRSSGSWPTLF